MRVRIGFSADTLQQHFKRRHAELQTQRTIAIIRIEPIVTGLQAHSRGNQDCFVTSAANLKEDAVLVLHLNFFVVEPPRQIHRAKHFQHLFAAELWQFTFALLRRFRRFRRFSRGSRSWFDDGYGSRSGFGPGDGFSREGLLGEFPFGLSYKSENFSVAHDSCGDLSASVLACHSVRNSATGTVALQSALYSLLMICRYSSAMPG